MTTTWTPVDVRPQSGDVFGDEQIGKAYSVRFTRKGDPRSHTDTGDPRHGPIGAHRTERLYSVITATFYVAARLDDEGELEPDSDGEPVIWLASQTERMVCTDPDDPGSTERWSDLSYDNYDRFFATVKAAEAFALQAAELYLKDPPLFGRDFDWDGLAPWEKR